MYMEIEGGLSTPTFAALGITIEGFLHILHSTTKDFIAQKRKETPGYQIIVRNFQLED